ncbi:phosphoribosyltransferase [Bdellovibrio sp. qaytius]|nr:phosphoribosyltransferase [Bdellovibrio sp. qaytius]
MKQIFRDRKQAGRLLATHLQKAIKLDRMNSLILALPRGGVPVAVEVASVLNIPLDILVVRKIGHPYQPEYGIGAITEEGFYWTDPGAVRVSDIQPQQIQQVVEKESLEVARRVKAYRHDKPLPFLHGKTVLLVDDGLATGVTARVAAQYIRSKGATRIILAVPIAPDTTVQSQPPEFDDIVCFQQSPTLLAVGQFYLDFAQVSDQEVIDIMNSRSSKVRESYI